MFCKNCGKEIPNRAVVCVHCGCGVVDKPSTEFEGTKVHPPKSVISLVIGIVSFLMVGIPIVGLTLSIIGVSISGMGLSGYRRSPEKYLGTSMLTTGNVLSIIALVLSAILFILMIFWVIFWGGYFAFWWGDLLDDML